MLLPYHAPDENIEPFDGWLGLLEERVNEAKPAYVMWKATTAYAEKLCDLLRSLKPVGTEVYLTVAAEGLRAEVLHGSRMCCAQVFLDADLFTKYESLEPALLNVHLGALVSCLQTFAEWDSEDAVAPSACFFSWDPESQLQIHFAQELMTSTCQLANFATDSYYDGSIEFDSERVMLQAIIPASVFTATIRDLESVETKCLRISASLDPPQLEVESAGDLATSKFVLPNDPGVLEALVISEAEGIANSFEYDFRYITKCREAQRLARRVSLRYDVNGVLSMQFLCEVEEAKDAFIEFKFLPFATAE